MNLEAFRVNFYPTRFTDQSLDFIDHIAGKFDRNAPKLFRWMREVIAAERWRRLTETEPSECPIEQRRFLLRLDEWNMRELAEGLEMVMVGSDFTDAPTKAFWAEVRLLLVTYISHLLKTGAIVPAHS